MKYIMKFCYDGSYFRGFATQPHKNTVQDNIESALKKITFETTFIFATSRTDKGVHAYVQYASFDLNKSIPCSNLKRALNNVVSTGLKVLEIVENVNNINPRYDCKNKTYVYKISKCDDVFKRRYYCYLGERLDIKKMKSAAKYFIGKKDFSSVCSTNTSVRSKVREINYVNITNTNEEILIRINADGFLYNMVRIIVGNLIAVGLNEIPDYKIKSILDSKDRKNSFKTAPCEGLYLEEINF